MSAALAPVVALLVALAGLALLLHPRLAGCGLDQPNHRSLHARAVPRTGGIALMAGMGLLLVLVLGLAAVSLLDDLRGLPVSWRLFAHLLAASMLAGTLDTSNAMVLALALLGCVWMTNLYNFMDGSDGLAGGMALFGFGFYALVASLQGDSSLALLNACISLAVLAFLLFNLHPARLFMGDAGSIPLGFLAAALGLCGWQRGLWPAWFPPLAFAPFVADATVTLARRLLHGEKVWQAHHEHYCQCLVQLGLGASPDRAGRVWRDAGEWRRRRAAAPSAGAAAGCGRRCVAGRLRPRDGMDRWALAPASLIDACGLPVRLKISLYNALPCCAVFVPLT